MKPVIVCTGLSPLWFACPRVRADDSAYPCPSDESLHVKIAVYANCQSTAIGFMLTSMIPSSELVRLSPVQRIPKSQRSEFLAKIVSADIVVHQPIGDGFVASSDELRATFPKKVFVSFPSVYFAAMSPQMCGLKHYAEGAINGPLGAYHDARIIREYLKGATIDQCLTALSDAGPSLLSFFDPMLAEAKAREKNLDVQCMDIVEDHYREQNLFHTFNHPSNFLLWRITERIASRLGRNEPANEARFPKPFLNHTIAAIPPSIAAYHELKWSQDNYVFDGRKIEMPDLVSDFYSIYSHHDDFRDVCKRSGTRISIPIF
ncbi:hypothetical protein H5395_18220 [Paracoccus sp. MC1854]|uniref:WcbI family polysaccharide biosynthesis putative acetyltransferase n=1 Tax=Paracoccus sp. MC1854 TaxID=2760306 RepID=UPI00160395D1|nr:WcbI family polysaccharide biosynthesis putative acetyltransferase [Paracoccus sp. MC1854]MBB1493367.1 hypothetical protein [Paracoccus sp. MC1854]